MLTALGFAPSTADPSLFLRTDTLLPPFYILVYINDLVFATADTAGLAHVKSELQKRHMCTDLSELRSYLGLQITRDRARRTIILTQSHMVQQVHHDFTYSSPQATPLSTRHSLSALPSDESVEPSGPYPELVGCLIHRPEHMAAAKRVLRYFCSTSGMGLVLGGQSPVVLTGHADASWVDDLATKRSSYGYTFCLGSGSVSWRSTPRLLFSAPDVKFCMWSLRRPVYGLRQAPREWHDTLRTTLVALGFALSTADPSLFLRTDTTLPPFYVLVYVDDLVFTTADTEALAHVKFELRKRNTCTDLAPPLDESVEPICPYPELVGCLMYLLTCTRPDLAYPLSLLARYVAPGRHRKVHWDAAKRVLRYLCSTSGMGLVLGGRARVVLTGHTDASYVDDMATQRSSQGYTFSLGSGSVSWQSTRTSSVLSSSCEAEIYAGAMAAQELRWLTYLLTDLGEAPRSPPVQYVDNKAMLALC
ncbi:unnamed protein product [Closterium sp. NIES-54]